MNPIDTEPGSQLGLFGLDEPVPVKGERVAHDFYPTPEPVTVALMNAYPFTGRIIEPFAGTNAITNVLNRYRDEGSGITDIESSDITWAGPNRDALAQSFWTARSPPDWTVSNPPFNVAAEALALAFTHSRHGVAFLLRLSFAEPTKGRAVLLQNLADHLVLYMPVSPRPKHRKDTKGSDSVTVGWFVWDKRHSWSRLGLVPPFQYLTNWKAKSPRLITEVQDTTDNLILPPTTSTTDHEEP